MVIRTVRHRAASFRCGDRRTAWQRLGGARVGMGDDGDVGAVDGAGSASARDHLGGWPVGDEPSVGEQVHGVAVQRREPEVVDRRQHGHAEPARRAPAPRPGSGRRGGWSARRGSGDRPPGRSRGRSGRAASHRRRGCGSCAPASAAQPTRSIAPADDLVVLVAVALERGACGESGRASPSRSRSARTRRCSPAPRPRPGARPRARAARAGRARRAAPAPRRAMDAVDRLEDRRLAAAVGPEQADEPSVRRRCRLDVRDDPPLADVDAQLAQLEAHPPRSRTGRRDGGSARSASARR